MTKSALIEAVSEKTGIVKKDVEAVLDTVLETITATLKLGDEVVLTGFGSFMSRLRKARLGVNPLKPNEKIQMPEVTVPKFRAGKALKEALKNK